MTEFINAQGFIQEFIILKDEVADFEKLLEKNGLESFSNTQLQEIVSLADELCASSMEIMTTAEKTISRNNRSQKSIPEKRHFSGSCVL